MTVLNHATYAISQQIRAMAAKMSDADPRHDLLIVEPEVKTKRPPFYKVVLLNDDFTPMDFVVHVLKSLFHKSHEDAVQIMLDVHNNGAGVCGVFTRDVAETKVDLVTELAKRNDHPLKCVMEKE